MRIRGLIFENLQKIMGSFLKGSSQMSSASKTELMWPETSPFCGCRFRKLRPFDSPSEANQHMIGA